MCLDLVLEHQQSFLFQIFVSWLHKSSRPHSVPDWTCTQVRLYCVCFFFSSFFFFFLHPWCSVFRSCPLRVGKLTYQFVVFLVVSPPSVSCQFLLRVMWLVFTCFCNLLFSGGRFVMLFFFWTWCDSSLYVFFFFFCNYCSVWVDLLVMWLVFICFCSLLFSVDRFAMLP